MTAFEADLRRDGHATSPRGLYRIDEQDRGCWSVSVSGETREVGAFPRTSVHGTREQAVFWAVCDEVEARHA